MIYDIFTLLNYGLQNITIAILEYLDVSPFK